MDSENRSGSYKHSSITEEEALVHSDESLDSSSEKFKNCNVTKDNDTENATSEVIHSHTKSASREDFQIDPSRLDIPEPLHHNAPSKEENSSQVEERINDVDGGTLRKLEKKFGSSHSLSQFTVVTHESLVPNSSPKKSPPIQVMERVNGYDPNRISASVFGKPPGPLDWSVASTESLFSIQIGSLSFARDLKLEGDLRGHKETGTSVDFDYSSEWYRSEELKNSSDLIRSRQPSPAKTGRGHRLQCIDSGKSQVFGKPGENVPDKAISIQGWIDPDEAYSHTGESKSDGPSCTSPIKNSSSPPCLCTLFSCACCSYEHLCCSICLPMRPCSSNCSSCLPKQPCCSCCKFKGLNCCLPKWPCCSCFSSCLPKQPCCSCCKFKGLNWSSCCSCKKLNWPSCSCKSLCMPSYCCKWPSCSISNCSCFSRHKRLGGSRCSCGGLNWLSC